jgi:hypothetical protein
VTSNLHLNTLNTQNMEINVDGSSLPRAAIRTWWTEPR